VKQEEALATLKVYFRKYSGIGEHSNLLAEITKVKASARFGAGIA
jgi:hypothetical protein